MAISAITAVFAADVQTVWDTVTDLENHAWRTDLSRIEVLNATKFVEYTTTGYATTFTITATEPCSYWAFDLQNDNLSGHWSGRFRAKAGQTEIVFTEDVQTKKIWMLPFLKFFLKKQQEQYIAALRKALSESV